MILVDTSVWIDHFRSHDAVLAHTLQQDEVLIHPFVIGEIALGALGNRQDKLASLSRLAMAVVAIPAEVSRLIEAERLYSLGIGYVDVHLLASTRLTRDARLWTRDRRLRSVSERLGIAARMVH